MCGIVGVFGQISVALENTFSDLLIFDQVRGFDSTGVCIVPKVNQNPNILKGVVSPAYLLGSKDYGDITKASLLCMLGHNRAATKGTVEQKNAHPFTHGHITGVHNGTATSVSSLLDHERFPVDSDNIYYHLSQKGVKDMWKNFYGAAALVWWDNKEKSLNMLRNYQRPLSMATTEDNSAIIWASEAEMLRCAADRRKIKIGEIVEVTPNQLYTFIFSTKVDITTEACPAYSYTYSYGGARQSYLDEEDYDRNWGWNRRYDKSREKTTEEIAKKVEEAPKQEGRGSEDRSNPSSSVRVSDLRAYELAEKELDEVEAINEESAPFRWMRSRDRFVCPDIVVCFMNIARGERNKKYSTVPF